LDFWLFVNNTSIQYVFIEELDITVTVGLLYVPVVAFYAIVVADWANGNRGLYAVITLVSFLSHALVCWPMISGTRVYLHTYELIDR
jgi:hypothetical protein